MPWLATVSAFASPQPTWGSIRPQRSRPFPLITRHRTKRRPCLRRQLSSKPLHPRGSTRLRRSHPSHPINRNRTKRRPCLPRQLSSKPLHPRATPVPCTQPRAIRSTAIAPRGARAYVASFRRSPSIPEQDSTPVPDLELDSWNARHPCHCRLQLHGGLPPRMVGLIISPGLSPGSPNLEIRCGKAPRKASRAHPKINLAQSDGTFHLLRTTRSHSPRGWSGGLRSRKGHLPREAPVTLSWKSWLPPTVPSSRFAPSAETRSWPPPLPLPFA